MIQDRDPREVVRDRLPLVEDDVVCLGCGTPFVVVRELDTDYHRAQCPECLERDAELESEAPQRIALTH